MKSDADHLPPVPTAWLFGYLATVYAWLAEIAVAILHFVAGMEIPVVPHVVLVCATLALTGIAWWRRADYELLRPSRGRILLTRGQAVLVTLFVMGVVVLFTWVAISICGL